MAKLIATIITVVVVLGLIGGSVLKMKADTENLGSKTEMEQNRLNKVVDNPGSVTGIIVKEELATYTSSVVKVYASNGTTALSEAEIKDKALFRKDVSFDENGDISLIEFTQIDLDK